MNLKHLAALLRAITAIALVCGIFAFPSSGQAGDPPPVETMDMTSAYPPTGDQPRSMPGQTPTVHYTYYQTTISLQADGKATQEIEINAINETFAEWSVYSHGWQGWEYIGNFRAWDEQGPLKFTSQVLTDRTQLTVNLRRSVGPGGRYRFWVAVDLKPFAELSDGIWSGGINNAINFPTDLFVRVIDFPSNAKLVDYDPAPTSIVNNRLEWRIENPPTGVKQGVSFWYELSDILSVQPFLQHSLPWGPQRYGKSTAPDPSIGRWGCAMTSEAMVFNYWAEKRGVSFRTDPEIFNNYLNATGGYSGGVNIYHTAVAKYARDHGILMYYHDQKFGDNDTNDNLIDHYIRSGSPIVLGVNRFWSEEDQKWISGHFVTVTGITTVNGVRTWQINDPNHGVTTLAEKYQNTYWQLVLYGGNPAGQELITISAHSPIQIMVTDAQGRRAGYDPVSGETILEIPGSDYHLEGIAASDDPSIHMEPAKFLSVPSPLDGVYHLEIFGTGDGEYKVYAAGTSWNGETDIQVFSGVAAEGSHETADIAYDGAAGFSKYIYLPAVTSR